MQLNICWWNTRLTPPVGKFINQEVNTDLNQKVGEVIDSICNEKPLDMVVLCEVSNRDEKLIKEIASKNELNYVMASSYMSGVYYDFAILFENTKIKIISTEAIDDSNSFKQQLRVGVIVEAEFDGVGVSLFLSHWNSDMFDGTLKKSHCASALRKKIDGHLRKRKDLLILIGDYNSQPFDEEITVDLQTTKDLSIIKECPDLIYNPFWRNLDSRTDGHSYSGSYYSKGNAHDKWKTFDQMMFSHKFIYGDSWILDVYSPEVHRKFDSLTFDFMGFFDHIPIYGGLKNDARKDKGINKNEP